MVISCRPTGGFARRRQLLGSGSCSPAVTINNRNKAYSSANYLKLAFTSVALPSPPSLPAVPGARAVDAPPPARPQGTALCAKVCDSSRAAEFLMAADFIPLTGRIVLQEQHSPCSPRPRRPHLHDKVGACAASPWRVEVCRSQAPHPVQEPSYMPETPCFHAL